MARVVAPVVRVSVRVFVAIMGLVVIVVVVVPNMDSVAAVFVGPLDLGVEMGTFAFLVAFNRVVGVSPAVTKFPGVRIGDARIPFW